MFRNLLARWWTRPARQAPYRHPRRPMALEALEDRVVPALVDFGSLVTDPTRFDQEHILVQVQPGLLDPTQVSMPEGVTFESAVGLVPGLWEVRLGEGTTVQEALAAFQNTSWVVGASPNYILSIGEVPNDPLYSNQWALNNTGQTGGTVDADIDAPQARDVTQGSSDVIVAVLDTGIDYTHEDLAANIWTNSGEIAGNGVDDDSNGFIDDVHGYDFANDDGDPMDDHGHGTHVAGIIGAEGDNDLGVIGVAPGVRLMAVKFLDASGNGTTADAIRALNYAVQMGASISNNSYGGSSSEDADPLFLEAIQNAAQAGHIFVAGAGNSGTNNDQAPFYPANFDSDNIISVAATDHNDRLASFSNYGATTVGLAAPGVDILSTVPGGDYELMSGTSMATPYVTGAVALVRSLHPDWTYQQVIERVLNTVDYLPGLDGRVLTAGRLNVARALLDSDGPRVVSTDPAGGVGGAISNMRVSFNEPIDPATFTAADIASFTGPNSTITLTGVSVVAGSFNRKFDISFAAQATKGNYTLVLGPNIADASGNLMDQDGDGTFGEATQDQYTATFNIGDQYVFNSTDTPVSFSLFSAGRSYLTVTDDLGIADLNVRVNVSSGDVGFLNLSLVGPDGTRVALAPITASPAGAEYRNTVFDDEASTPIAGAASPFEGNFRPSGSLSVFDGDSTKGTWRLETSSLYDGTINSWSLQVIATPPKVTVSDVSLAEGNNGTTQATFTVSLAHVVGDTVAVDYATADGTASAGSDYASTSGTLTFAPGELMKTVTVTVHGDTVDEGDENFFLNLSNVGNATISDSQAVATIKNDEIGVSAGDVTVTEGNNGNVSALFTVTLSQASTHAVTVQYATAPGTATAGTDYVSASGTLNFAAGQTSKTVAVSVKGDTWYESAETFFVNLTATDAYAADSQAVATITNNDAVPVMFVNDVAVTEGNNGTKVLSFSVLLANATDRTATVNYATANGTATAGSDYTAISGTLTFAAGQTSKAVSVVVAGDTDAEASETVLLNLSGAFNAIMLDSQAVGTVLNDDVSISINDVTVAEGDDGSFDATFTVSLSDTMPADVTVNYATANGTAWAGTDFVAASGTLTFAAGQTSKTVTVHGIADRRDELDEAFFVNLTNAVNATIADAQGQATITDDDAAPTISVNDVSVVEGHSGTKALTFTVTLSAASGQSISVNYATADGTASSSSDYQSRSGTLTFSAGSTSQTVAVTLNADTSAEADETILFNLSNASNATIADDQGVGTIQDDDSLVVDDVAVTEGDNGTSVVTFTVRLLAARSVPVTVNYATASSTASAGSDFVATSGSLTFAAGETTKSLDVLIIGDARHEADETFFLNLSNAVGTPIADGQGAASITNDDATPSLSITDVALAEGNSGTRSLTFTVTLSQPSGQAVSVQYATADGSATSGDDYASKSGTLTISAGFTTATFTVTANGDASQEGDETFLVNLSNATNATLADDQAVGTIVDDDPLPALSIADVVATEGNSGTKTYAFYVTLSAASTQAVSVQVAAANGTAASGSDYVARTETVTFGAGQTSKAVYVTVNGDTAVEASEAFYVRLSAPTNAVIADVEAVGTIQNDDSSLRVNDVTVAEGDSGTTNAEFTITLTGAVSDAPVTVNYTLSNSTATGGVDFIATGGTVTFAPGQTTQMVSVPIVGDVLNEANETFYLNLAGAVNATIADSQGVATITGSDPVPVLTIDGPVITEGNSGTKNLTYTVRLSAPSGRTVSVNYATANGTASSSSDYQAKSGTLTFNAGATSQAVTVVLNGDTSAEADETVLLNLSNATNATISDSQGVGTIQDDDSLVVDDVTITEGDAGTSVVTFTVRLLVARSSPVTVNYATANGTATAGVDYLATSGSLTFAGGETSETVSVTLVGDSIDEQNETFYLNLSSATGTIIADGQGVAAVTDDDGTPSISMSSSASTAEGNTGTKLVTFTFTLSQPSGQPVSFNYATADETATAGTDYVGRSGTLTFNPGVTVLTLTVTVNGDAANEGNETFTLAISNPTNATIATSQGTATIVDDDTLPVGGGSMQVAGGGLSSADRALLNFVEERKLKPYLALLSGGATAEQARELRQFLAATAGGDAMAGDPRDLLDALFAGDVGRALRRRR